MSKILILAIILPSIIFLLLYSILFTDMALKQSYLDMYVNELAQTIKLTNKIESSHIDQFRLRVYRVQSDSFDINDEELFFIKYGNSLDDLSNNYSIGNELDAGTYVVIYITADKPTMFSNLSNLTTWLVSSNQNRSIKLNSRAIVRVEGVL